jgi:hypothetical protein
MCGTQSTTSTSTVFTVTCPRHPTTTTYYRISKCDAATRCQPRAHLRLHEQQELGVLGLQPLQLLRARVAQHLRGLVLAHAPRLQQRGLLKRLLLRAARQLTRAEPHMD